MQLLRRRGQLALATTSAMSAQLAAFSSRALRATDLGALSPDRSTLFGPLGPAHPFGVSTYDHRPWQEAKLTRNLADCLMARDQGAARSIALLQTLAELESRLNLKGAAPPYAAQLNESSRVTVTAEQPVNARKGSTNGRIDLLIEWGRGAERATVVIEAKLGALVTPTQLSRYRSFAKSRAKGCLPPALYLVTLGADSAAGRNRDWVAVRWFDLMRRWEQRLATLGDDDAGFAAVRSSIWHHVVHGEKR